MNGAKKSRFGAAVVLPVVLIVVTVVYLFEALRTMGPLEEGTGGPSFFPVVVSVIMLIALVPVLLKGLRAAPPADADTPARPIDYAAPVQVVLATVVYIALFKPAGYFLSTALYVLALLFVFRFKGRNRFVNLLWAVLIAGGCFLLFSEIFQIRLPKLGGII